MDPNQYYQNLMQQGYNSADAVHFTQQYYPNFDGPAQQMAMMTPPPGSMEMGGMAAGGFGAPAGGMAAGGITAGGAVAGGAAAAVDRSAGSDGAHTCAERGEITGVDR